jgi:hypothetical protein
MNTNSKAKPSTKKKKTVEPSQSNKISSYFAPKSGRLGASSAEPIVLFETVAPKLDLPASSPFGKNGTPKIKRTMKRESVGKGTGTTMDPIVIEDGAVTPVLENGVLYGTLT